MTANEYIQTHETVCTEVGLLDTSVEQPIERDLVLPDYYPDIFRILRCSAQPRVVSQTVSGGRLSFEMEVLVTVLYLSEGSKAISCVEQRLPLSKSLEIGDEFKTPMVRVTPACTDVSCRVVNKRRLDIRGTVTSRVRVTADKLLRALSGARGQGVQLKKETVRYPVKRLSAAKRITVIDELELGESKAPLGTPLRCGCVINKGDNKVIAGKLVTKGEAELTVVYSCVDPSGSAAVESMKFTMPFSQIIDIDGIDETYVPSAEITAAGCSVLPKGEDGRKLECELTLNVICTGVKYVTGELVTDGYFTGCEDEKTMLEGTLEACPEEKVLTAECSAVLEWGEGISSVTDCFGTCGSVSVVRNETDGQSAALTGTAELCIMGADREGMPFFARTTAAFETDAAIPEGSGDPEVTAEVVSAGYILSSDDKAEVRARLRLTARYPASIGASFLTELKPLTDKPRETDRRYALKLCRAGEGESLWDIAKRYSTSAEAIREANEEGAGGLLLIPII